jgi:hypothetical protein
MVGSCTAQKECVAAALAANSSFDVEMAIADFLADPSRACLELPCSLNAEQRKQAKKLAEQHADIKCESFGLGNDRKVHLFKLMSGRNSMPGCSPQGVSIKNTFIDDWIGDACKGPNERCVQSMPHNMFCQCLSVEEASCAASTMEDSEVLASSSVSTATSSGASDLDCESRWADVDLLEEQVFALGSDVVIDGLIKAPSFNGSCGTVKSWDAESGRYNVLLWAAVGKDGQQWAKIKSENLRQFQPSPQHYDPFRLRYYADHTWDASAGLALTPAR